MATKLRFRELVATPVMADAHSWQRAGWARHRRGARLVLELSRHGGFRATLLHRIAHWASELHIRSVPTLIHELNQALHGIEMTPSMPVGPGLYLAHTVGSVITADRIGADVELQGGITIGQRRGDGFPILEDGVLVAAGARVLGPIRVGVGSTIGANAVVVRDVAPGDTMVGVPARPIAKTDIG